MICFIALCLASHAKKFSHSSLKILSWSEAYSHVLQQQRIVLKNCVAYKVSLCPKYKAGLASCINQVSGVVWVLVFWFLHFILRGSLTLIGELKHLTHEILSIAASWSWSILGETSQLPSQVKYDFAFDVLYLSFFSLNFLLPEDFEFHLSGFKCLSILHHSESTRQCLLLYNVSVVDGNTCQ